MAAIAAIILICWIHLALFLRGAIPLGYFREHFAEHTGWWFLLMLVLSWMQVAVTTYIYLRISPKPALLGVALWIAEVTTMVFILAGLQSY
jgi:hypothetical protein